MDALVLPHLYDHYRQLAQEVDPSAVTALQVLLPSPTAPASHPTHNKDKGKKRKEKQEKERSVDQMYVGPTS